MSNEENFTMATAIDAIVVKSPGGIASLISCWLFAKWNRWSSASWQSKIWNFRYEVREMQSFNIWGTSNKNYLLVTLSSHDKLPGPSSIPFLLPLFASCKPR